MGTRSGAPRPRQARETPRPRWARRAGSTSRAGKGRRKLSSAQRYQGSAQRYQGSGAALPGSGATLSVGASDVHSQLWWGRGLPQLQRRRGLPQFRWWWGARSFGGGGGFHGGGRRRLPRWRRWRRLPWRRWQKVGTQQSQEATCPDTAGRGTTPFFPPIYPAWSIGTKPASPQTDGRRGRVIIRAISVQS